VNALKHTPVVLTPRSAPYLVEDVNCKHLQLGAMTSKLVLPIICHKTVRTNEFTNLEELNIGLGTMHSEQLINQSLPSPSAEKLSSLLYFGFKKYPAALCM